MPPLTPDKCPEKADETPISRDERFMREALHLAEYAGQAGEVPIGAVLVHNEQIIGRGANSPIRLNDPTAHAEVIAIREGAAIMRNYRLGMTTLYVTLEPCPMCAGALVNARVSRLVFACRDLRFGAVRSKFRIADSPLLNHQLQVTEGLLAAECRTILQSFFDERR